MRLSVGVRLGMHGSLFACIRSGLDEDIRFSKEYWRSEEKEQVLVSVLSCWIC